MLFRLEFGQGGANQPAQFVLLAEVPASAGGRVCSAISSKLAPAVRTRWSHLALATAYSHARVLLASFTPVSSAAAAENVSSRASAAYECSPSTQRQSAPVESRCVLVVRACQPSRIACRDGCDDLTVVHVLAVVGLPAVIEFAATDHRFEEPDMGARKGWYGTEPTYASSLVAAASGGACRSRWDLTVTGSGHGMASSGSSNAIETSSDGSCTRSI